MATAYTGAWRSNVQGQLATLKAKEVAVKKRAQLPGTHKEDLADLERKLDQYGFDILVRVGVVTRDGSQAAQQAVQSRLQAVARALNQYDRAGGSMTQGFIPDAKKPIVVPLDGPPPARTATAAPLLDRHPRPLSPLGRPLDILNAGELATLWHLPTRALADQPGLTCWQRARQFPAPVHVRVPEEGVTDNSWQRTGQIIQDLPEEGATASAFVGGTPTDLRRGTYVLGGAGTGKTEWMKTQVEQHLVSGRGVSILDPKGDFAEDTLGMTPPDREGDVYMFDPGDITVRIPGLNMLAKRPGVDPALVQSEVLSIIAKLIPNFDQAPLMQRFLGHAVRLLIDVEDHPDMLNLYQMLQARDENGSNPYRESLIARAVSGSNREVSQLAREFWQNEVPAMDKSQRNSLQTALTRIERFLSNEIVMGIVAQPRSTINIRQLMDNRGIFVGRMSQDTLGGDVQSFLGSLVLQEFIYLGDPIVQEDLQHLDPFHMTQIVLANNRSSGPMTVAPLPLARPAANPGRQGTAPEDVRRDPRLTQWLGPPAIPRDAVTYPRIATLLGGKPGETQAAQFARIQALYRQLHGAERDPAVVPILAALEPPDFLVYQQIRQQVSLEVRAQILAHPQLIPDKHRRIKQLSWLRDGTPQVEIRAVVQRRLGAAGTSERGHAHSAAAAGPVAGNGPPPEPLGKRARQIVATGGIRAGDAPRPPQERWET